MVYFWLGFMLGGVIAIALMVVSQVNSNIENELRADHAVNMAKHYYIVIKKIKTKMIESKYEQLNTQYAKDYNKFVDWWLKEIDAILKGGNE